MTSSSDIYPGVTAYSAQRGDLDLIDELMAPQTPIQARTQRKLNLWLVSSFVPVILGPIGGLLGVSFGTSTLVVAAFAAAIDDTCRKKIANWITYPAFLWLVAVSLAYSVSGMNWLGSVGLGDMMLGGFCCFVIVFLPYLFGVGGGGDAKIAAVIGVGLGFQYGLIAIGSAFVLAALFAITRETWQKGPFFIIRTIYRWFGFRFSIWVLPPSEEDQKFLKHPLPMGLSFFAGVLLTITGILPKMIL